MNERMPSSQWRTDLSNKPVYQEAGIPGFFYREDNVQVPIWLEEHLKYLKPQLAWKGRTYNHVFSYTSPTYLDFMDEETSEAVILTVGHLMDISAPTFKDMYSYRLTSLYSPSSYRLSSTFWVRQAYPSCLAVQQVERPVASLHITDWYAGGRSSVTSSICKQCIQHTTTSWESQSLRGGNERQSRTVLRSFPNMGCHLESALNSMTEPRVNSWLCLWANTFRSWLLGRCHHRAQTVIGPLMQSSQITIS